MMIDAPCKDCAQRHINCHASCEAYLKARKELDRVNAKRKEYNAAMADQVSRIMRMQKRIKRNEKH